MNRADCPGEVCRMPRENINTTQYWDARFDSGDWESVGGREQTQVFANDQVRRIGLSRTFSGTVLDFGCGLGDAIPIYREAFPAATLMGIDVSAAAIDRCRQRYGTVASFRQGDHTAVPLADVIIASNVLEHVSDPVHVARVLRSRCSALHIVVPFREWPRIDEHIHTFDRHSFSDVGPCQTKVYASAGWGQFGWNRLWLNIYLKNVIRPLAGRQTVRRRKQIMYSFHPPQASVRSQHK
jgi:SAM-dependent methyltransferase